MQRFVVPLLIKVVFVPAFIIYFKERKPQDLDVGAYRPHWVH